MRLSQYTHGRGRGGGCEHGGVIFVAPPHGGATTARHGPTGRSTGGVGGARGTRKAGGERRRPERQAKENGEGGERKGGGRGPRTEKAKAGDTDWGGSRCSTHTYIHMHTKY